MTDSQLNGKAQLHKQQRLFQNKTLTALFGTSIATMVTRITIMLAIVGTLTIISIGLLKPGNSQTGTPSSTSSTSGSTVGSQIGNLAPNFTLADVNGKKLSLSDFRGRPIMLNFWYATCPGCVAEISDLQKVYSTQQASGKDFVILGINVLDDSRTTTQFAQHYGLSYPLMLDQNQQVTALYNINATPTSYFIDRHGVIREIVVAPLDEATLQKEVNIIS